MKEESITLGPAERRRLDVINLLGGAQAGIDASGRIRSRTYFGRTRRL